MVFGELSAFCFANNFHILSSHKYFGFIILSIVLSFVE
jgi:hypothetical protein